jgi:hypothetical protein
MHSNVSNGPSWPRIENLSCCTSSAVSVWPSHTLILTILKTLLLYKPANVVDGVVSQILQCYKQFVLGFRLCFHWPLTLTTSIVRGHHDANAAGGSVGGGGKGVLVKLRQGVKIHVWEIHWTMHRYYTQVKVSTTRHNATSLLTSNKYQISTNNRAIWWKLNNPNLSTRGRTNNNA